MPGFAHRTVRAKDELAEFQAKGYPLDRWYWFRWRLDTLSVAEPVVRWAGGKRQLLDTVLARVPGRYRYYFEPLFGNGAVLSGLQPTRMTLNDINMALMSLYRRIQHDPEGVISAVGKVDADIPADKTLAKEYFYALQGRYSELIACENYGLESDALALFLNKHCFNGSYRVNSKGRFNVPFDGSLRGSFDESNTRAVFQASQGTTLLNTDFKQACAEAIEENFVFLDSPYAPPKTDTFRGYTKKSFSLGDHERLTISFRELHKRSCFVMFTNHNTPLTRELYAGCHLEVVPARRAINSDATRRGGVEVIIANFREHWP